MKPTRVAMLVTNDVVHDNRVLREARALHAFGYDVTVLGLVSERFGPTEDGDSPSSTSRARSGFRIKRFAAGNGSRGFGFGIPALQAWTGHLADYYRLGPSGRFLCQAALDERADIYHAHDLDTLVPASLAAAENGAKLVYDVHELYPELILVNPSYRSLQGEIKRRLYYWMARRIEERFAPKADLVVTVCAGIGDVLRDRYGISRVEVVRNLPTYSRHEPRGYFHAALRIPSQARLVLYQGVIGPGRGLEALVRATPYLPPEVHVVFLHLGDRAPLQALAHELGVGPRVHFHPAVNASRLPEVTPSADVGVVLAEPLNLHYVNSCPNKLFEYIMAGIPVVATDLPEHRKILVKHDLGLIVPSLEPAVLARSLLAGIEMKRDEAFRARSRAVTASHLNWEAERETLVGAYERLVS